MSQNEWGCFTFTPHGKSAFSIGPTFSTIKFLQALDTGGIGNSAGLLSFRSSENCMLYFPVWELDDRPFSLLLVMLAHQCKFISSSIISTD